MTILIKNVNAVLTDGVASNQYVLFDERIQAIGPVAEAPDCLTVVDGTGLFVAPGFIDNHIHGCGGDDAMDGQDALRRMAALLPQGGTTAFCPTSVAATPQDVRRMLGDVREVRAEAPEGARLLGAHVEGPFLCVKYKGAHEEALLTDPDFGILEPFADVVKVVTLAPELEGAQAFIERCAAREIVCSLGHTNADYDLCLQALRWGAQSFTHTYNAMTPLTHRQPGAVGAAMASQAYAELICDNIHVHPAAQAILFRSKGADRLMLITDALRPCMKGDGPFTLGNLHGTVVNGQARLPDGTLAGSVLTMNKAVKHLTENTGCPLYEAVRCATLNPATLLGLPAKGRLAAGMDADLVLLTSALEVSATYVEGRCVYSV